MVIIRISSVIFHESVIKLFNSLSFIYLLYLFILHSMCNVLMFGVYVFVFSKFMHKNVVKCLGVCFQELPKYIVLELLQGGDLRTFLRESRPTRVNKCPVNIRSFFTQILPKH